LASSLTLISFLGTLTITYEDTHCKSCGEWLEGPMSGLWDDTKMTKCSIFHREKGDLILALPQMRCLECISQLISEK
jgi:hypothetical protein